MDGMSLGTREGTDAAMNNSPQNAFRISNQKSFSWWHLLSAYWRSSHWLSAYAFLFLIVGMTIALVAFNVVFNYWYNYFYDALQAYNKYGVIRFLILFVMLAACYMFLAVYRYYAVQLFALRWRRWLTVNFIQVWLQNRHYYYLELFDGKTDNPEQRIQDDINALVNSSIDLSTGLIGSVATIVAFIYILWQLSGMMSLSLGPLGTWVVPGYLVWISILYATLGTLITFKIGKPLINLNYEQQRLEASFRFSAMELRTHSENIALFRGENQQNIALNQLFSKVLANWYLIIIRQKLLLWFTAGYRQASVLLPLAAALPNYFNKVFQLGGLMQSIKAFGDVQDALSFIVNSYPQIAEWQAVNRRLTNFVNHIIQNDELLAKQTQLQFQQAEIENIKVEHLTIYNPRTELMLKDITLEFNHGQNYLIKGRSGIGKSTFIKVIANLWPYASGKIITPKDKKIMFVAQRTFLPTGTLAEAILFPNPQLDREELKALLTKCDLANLISRLDESATWAEQLSPGEQQRIACIRILVQQPDWVFMDESTAMLDLKNEAYIYNFIKEKLPRCSIISIGHRESLEQYHDVVLNMEKFI